MTVANFSTQNSTFKSLLGNGMSYSIPRFQRDYSWEEEQWEDLYNDIMELYEDPDVSSLHYMGYLVLQSSNDKLFEVIDGQQRLTTISLLILSCLKVLRELINKGAVDEVANEKRYHTLFQSYIGFMDPISLNSIPRLSLNRNNNDYFKNFIVPLRDLPVRGYRASERLLRKAFLWFEDNMQKFVKHQQAETDKGVFLAKFIEFVTDRLFFTVITVRDEINAYKVFETLNARGIMLSSTDLLKNYLFSIIESHDENQHELKELESRWNKITERLQAEKFPDYLRAYWNSKYKLARHAELFKVIRASIKNNSDVYSLLRELEDELDSYLFLSSPELAEGYSPVDIKNAQILRLLRVSQPHSILLAAKRKLKRQDFSDFLRSIVVISFRYSTICGASPAELEKSYNNVAVKISNNELCSLHDIYLELRSVYISDDKFVYNFSDKIFRTTDSRINKVVKYILCSIENYLSNKECNYLAEDFNVEHIAPQHSDSDLDECFIDASDLIYRLGNMTLLSNSDNRALGNAQYSIKRDTYLKSDFYLTNTLSAKYATWSAQTINDWQHYLANQAKTVWRISKFD